MKINRPPVSCICLTYGRPHLLEEAIYAFLRQDYDGQKELIVLNDYAQQTLLFNHPEVRVINVPQRFRTVGEKMNVAVALATHNLLFVWDDDDIYLPHRLTFSVDRFEPAKGYFKPDKAWVLDNGRLEGPKKNLFHVGSCWSRQRFDAVRGYVADGTGYDWIFEQRLKAAFPDAIQPYTIKPEEIYYLYRWGESDSYNMSGFGSYRQGQNVGHADVEAFVAQKAQAGEIRQGVIHVEPQWKQDYRQLVADHLKALAQAEAAVPG